MWDFLTIYWPQLVSGVLVTIELFILSSALSIMLAVIFALMKLSRNPFVRGISITYIEFFRGTSLLVQLYWIFFVLPVFGLTLEKFSAGVIAVALNAGSYGAELVYGGVRAVPQGQWEAAYALSLPPLKKMWRIVLPQALVIILPAWGNLFIEVLKATALVSLISVSDLTFEVQSINQNTYLSAQAFGSALLIYYGIARFLLTPTVRWLEARLRHRLSRN
ncbi:ectoine/hydroxyectoine ABC transporter permease subunit EhuC [Sinorhizobium meliloti]|uniref:ectoine/hydroxyectoine ABC transporter permease subunit EhuC n=1 Tax=Rhizobium meliloti TaxID=382 RepID=UPI000D1E7D7B|nr:ectoine/hydroxyectoine ABC transporter permease subunit EhuC [Sinorhizobium meliloti]RMI14830.1 ectoine/hydroxyectoine ABC transporter permease subunit EhuC [Sinorhizobium meliloti]